MEKSIRVFNYRYLFDFWKPCFDKGNLIHDCILLPDLVENTYIESPTVGVDTIAANKLREIKGKRLGCWCIETDQISPIVCHGQVLLYLMNYV